MQGVTERDWDRNREESTGSVCGRKWNFRNTTRPRNYPVSRRIQRDQFLDGNGISEIQRDHGIIPYPVESREIFTAVKKKKRKSPSHMAIICLNISCSSFFLLLYAPPPWNRFSRLFTDHDPARGSAREGN